MRMMMKILISTESVNQAMKDGSVKQIMQTAFESLRPEASYFFPSEEGRTILLFVDVKDPSDIPAAGEHFFKGLNARVAFTPVMNAQDFQAGLAKLPR